MHQKSAPCAGVSQALVEEASVRVRQVLNYAGVRGEERLEALLEEERTNVI